MKKTQVGIVGLGWVGKACRSLFPDALVCDPAVEGSCSLDLINELCDVAFVAVPTPGLPGGALDTSVVERVVAACTRPLVVIRSTVQPGFCDYLEARYPVNVCMQPEYIGETVAHPLLDEIARKFLIIGGEPANRRRLIELYQQVYNANVTIRQVTNLEAEVIKLAENREIAFRVMAAQELYDACEAAEVDFYTVREAVYNDDPRMSPYFTFVYPDNRGFNSSRCLRKDVPAFCAWAESAGYDPVLTRALVQRSRKWAAAEEPAYTCDNRPKEERVR